MTVTIKNVAEETGLSLSTISKYINGGNVRDYNKKKIDAAIAKLNFSPNAMARGLKSSKSFSVGLVIPFLKDGYHAQMAALFEHIFHEAGYTLILSCHRDTIQIANKSIQFLAERKVDGVIFNASFSEGLDFAPLTIQNIPVVMCEQRIQPEHFDCITVDNVQGAYEAVEHLIKQGYRKIATITGDLKNNTAVERYRGYRRVLEDYCIPFDPSLVYKGVYDVVSGRKGMQALWQLEEKPDALFIANYHMCIGAFSVIPSLRITLPGDLAIATFDDLEYSQLVTPTLTSVRQPIEQLINETTDVLFKCMNGNFNTPRKYVRIKPELIVRNSSPLKCEVCSQSSIS